MVIDEERGFGFLGFRRPCQRQKTISSSMNAHKRERNIQVDLDVGAAREGFTGLSHMG